MLLGLFLAIISCGLTFIVVREGMKISSSLKKKTMVQKKKSVTFAENVNLPRKDQQKKNYTIVTGFFDIQRETWPGWHARSRSKYMTNAKSVLSLKDNMVGKECIALLFSSEARNNKNITRETQSRFRQLRMKFLYNRLKAD
jgi:hypothetical protein